MIIEGTGFFKKGTIPACSGSTPAPRDVPRTCQVAVFAAGSSPRGRTLVDRELYLPESWTTDRERCRAAEVPDDRAFATKTEPARALVTRALASPLPISWVTADALYGQDWHFRRMIEEAGLGYVVAVPKTQQAKSLAGCSWIDQPTTPGNGSTPTRSASDGRTDMSPRDHGVATLCEHRGDLCRHGLQFS
ncbi:transposase [Streptomyces sp. NPDC005202]|uniref:transposase n=1 Tax=Streptomyces sp. NPDC005202 TaxID=3157021 RepID=UPI0033BE0495